MASTVPNFSGETFSKRNCSRREDENLPSELTNREGIVEKIREVVVWQNPLVSLLYFIGVNILFWFLIYTELKLYGLIFIALLILSLRQLWNDQFRCRDSSSSGSGSRSRGESTADSAGNVSISACAKMNKFFGKCFEATNSACRELKRLRQEQPGMFCLLVCTLCLMAGVIGRTFSAAALLYALILTVMIVPGLIAHLLPPRTLEYFANLLVFRSSQKDNESVNGEEDYLPEENGETLELLHLAGDLHVTDDDGDDDDDDDDFMFDQMTTRTNDTTESFCSRFSIFSEMCMPYGEENFECHECEVRGGRSMDYSDDSEFSSINFLSRHYNGDTSDDEDLLEELRLKFKDVDRNTEDQESRDSLSSFLTTATAGLSLLGDGENVFTSETQESREPEVKRLDRESSSDTDSFELVAREDM